jgi:hypothetical protein
MRWRSSYIDGAVPPLSVYIGGWAAPFLLIVPYVEALHDIVAARESRHVPTVFTRAKDLDFAQRQIIVRDGKGAEDRVTIIASSRHRVAT